MTEGFVSRENNCFMLIGPRRSIRHAHYTTESVANHRLTPKSLRSSLQWKQIEGLGLQFPKNQGLFLLDV